MAALNLSKINRTALAERRTHKKISLIMNIMLAVAAVLCWMTDSSGLQILGLFLFCIGIGIGVIASVSVFREMTNSQMGDVKLSLPMSNAERFLSRLLTLSYIHIFPMIAFGALGTLGLYAGDGIVDGKEVWELFVIMIAWIMFVDSMTVFCTCCCGALAESIYFSIISIGCLSIVPGVMCFRMAQSFAGIGAMPKFINYWTFSSAFAVSDGTTVVKDVVIPNIISILISCLALFAAYQIFRRRDARSIGDPIAVRAFFEAIMLIGVFTVYSAFICTSSFNIGIIITAVIYITINIIVSRAKISFKKVLVWLAKLCATSLLFMAVVAAGFLTDGFGAYDHLPVRKMNNCDVTINTTVYINEEYDKEKIYLAKGSSRKDKEGPDAITDAEIRDMIKIARKYGIRDKSFDRFKMLVFDDYTNDNFWNDEDGDDTVYLNINVFKYNDKNEPRLYLDQTIYVRTAELDAMFDEMESKGYYVERKVSDYSDKYDYMDEVVY